MVRHVVDTEALHIAIDQLQTRLARERLAAIADGMTTVVNDLEEIPHVALRNI
jgi:hypothetical protein